MNNILTKVLAKALCAMVEKTVFTRPYDYMVDKDYMHRWFVIPRNRLFNIYAHHFIGSDAPTPHDHPWISLSIILSGQYLEHTPSGDFVRKSGSITLRGAKALHWIEIDKPVKTLFITGPRIRRWGFQCPSGWVDFREYLARRGSDRLASGCGELKETPPTPEVEQ